MAIFDAMLEFSDEQDISQAAGTAVATNQLDLVISDVNIGGGEPLWLNVRIGTEAVAEVDGATTGACTLVVALVYDDTAVDASSIVKYQTRALTETELTAGAWILRMPLPVAIDEEQYVGLVYTIGGATSAKGTINAWLDNGSSTDYNTQIADSNI